jgi:hypothetical protein
MFPTFRSRKGTDDSQAFNDGVPYCGCRGGAVLGTMILGVGVFGRGRFGSASFGCLGVGAALRGGRQRWPSQVQPLSLHSLARLCGGWQVPVLLFQLQPFCLHSFSGLVAGKHCPWASRLEPGLHTHWPCGVRTSFLPGTHGVGSVVVGGRHLLVRPFQIQPLSRHSRSGVVGFTQRPCASRLKPALHTH